MKKISIVILLLQFSLQSDAQDLILRGGSSFSSGYVGIEFLGFDNWGASTGFYGTITNPDNETKIRLPLAITRYIGDPSKGQPYFTGFMIFNDGYYINDFYTTFTAYDWSSGLGLGFGWRFAGRILDFKIGIAYVWSNENYPATDIAVGVNITELFFGY